MAATAAPPHILALNGDPTVLALLSATLEGAGHRVTTAACAADSAALVARLRPDLVVLDLAPGQPGGWSLLATLRGPGARWPPLVVLSTQPGYLEWVWDETGRYAACAVLAMPCDPDDLRAVVARALAT